MKDISTADLIDRVVLHARMAEKTRCILTLQPVAANASKNRQAERNLTNALKALNSHFKTIVREVDDLKHDLKMIMDRRDKEMNARIKAETALAELSLKFKKKPKRRKL